MRQLRHFTNRRLQVVLFPQLEASIKITSLLLNWTYLVWNQYVNSYCRDGDVVLPFRANKCISNDRGAAAKSAQAQSPAQGLSL